MNLSELKAALDRQIKALTDETRQKHVEFLELGIAIGRLQEANEVRQALEQRAGEGETAGGEEPPAITLPQLQEMIDDSQPAQTDKNDE